LDNRFPRTSVAGTICQKHKLLEKNINILNNFQACGTENIKFLNQRDQNIKFWTESIIILEKFQACGTENVKFSTSGTKNIKFFNQRGKNINILDNFQACGTKTSSFQPAGIGWGGSVGVGRGWVCGPWMGWSCGDGISEQNSTNQESIQQPKETKRNIIPRSKKTTTIF
jgi:hypothetical protein